jgi:hypothetical protein
VTQKPTCSYHSGSSSRGKGKGKTKKSKGSKKSKSKGAKSAKSKKSNDSHEYDNDYYYENYNYNIFDHEECGSSKASGNYEQHTPTPTKAPVQAPLAPVAGGSGDWSWDDGSTPSVVVGDSSRAPATVTVQDAQDGYGVSSQNQYGDLEGRASINEETEQQEASSESGVDAAFGSSAAMYGVLTGGVVVAIVAILVWKRPDPAFMCSKSSSSSAQERENMVIALVRGMNS